MKSLEQFPGATRTLGAPAGWDEAKDGPCGKLAIQVTEDGQCISYWHPDAAERSQIAQGHPVLLSVIGVQPPVYVGVGAEFRVEGVNDGMAVVRETLSELVKVIGASENETFSKDQVLAFLFAMGAAAPAGPAH